MALDNVIGVRITTANTVNTSGDPNVEGILGDNIWKLGHFTDLQLPGRRCPATHLQKIMMTIPPLDRLGFGEGTILYTTRFFRTVPALCAWLEQLSGNGPHTL